MLKDYDYSPLHYRLMHAMVQPALENGMRFLGRRASRLSLTTNLRVQ